MNLHARERRAVSLFEIVVAFGLIGFVLMTAGPKVGRDRSTTKGVAGIMASVFSEARQRAISQGSPVAVVVPSGDGSYGQSSSYYLLEGRIPKITRVVDLTKEHPGVNLFVGHWSVDPGGLVDPSLTPTVTPLRSQEYEGSFQLSKYRLPNPKDYAFIFAPSGRLYTNGLPHFDGEAHLVVTQGVESSPGTPPSGSAPTRVVPGTFEPKWVGSPYTLSLSHLGHVRVSTGLLAQAGGVRVTEEAPRATVPAPPLVDPPTAPRVLSVDRDPEPSGYGITDEDGRITPDEPLTLTTRAVGAGPIYAEWTADRGTLSHQGPTPLEFDEAANQWVSTWSYTPPLGAAPGDEVKLELRVFNDQGDAPAFGGGVQSFIVGGVEDAPLIVFTEDTELKTMNLDGTGKRVVRKVASDGYQWRSELQAARAIWSPDGSCFALADSSHWKIVHKDGTLLAEIDTEDMDINGVLSWNRFGTKIAFQTHESGGYPSWMLDLPSALWVSDSLGTNKQLLVRGTHLGLLGGRHHSAMRLYSGDEYGPLHWSPDGSRIAFASMTPPFPSDWVARSIRVDGSDLVSYEDASTGSSPTSIGPFSPDSSLISYCAKQVPGSRISVGYRSADGTGTPTEILVTPSPGDAGRWSEDGSQIVIRERWYGLDGTPGDRTPFYGVDITSNNRYDLNLMSMVPTPRGSWGRGYSLRVRASDGSFSYDIPPSHRNSRAYETADIPSD